jgi:hypothetical protein
MEQWSNFFYAPNVICDPSFHRERNPQSFVNRTEVITCIVKRERPTAKIKMSHYSVPAKIDRLHSAVLSWCGPGRGAEAMSSWAAVRGASEARAKGAAEFSAEVACGSPAAAAGGLG